MSTFKIELEIKYSEVKEVIYTSEKETIIKLKDNRVFTLMDKHARDVFKKVCRNFAGEHLD